MKKKPVVKKAAPMMKKKAVATPAPAPMAAPMGGAPMMKCGGKAKKK